MKTRELTITYYNYSTEAVPMIKIVGKWLNRYGFKIGDKVIICEKLNELVIRKQ